MTFKYKISRKFGLTNATARSARVYCVLGAFLLAAIMPTGDKSQLVSAGSEPAFFQGMDPAKVAAAIKGNAQELKAFTYQQRMQLQLKGETKKITLTQMNYDMNGNLQKTLLSEQPPADAQPSGGRIKQRIVAKKTGEFKDMMEEIAALVKSYWELPHKQLQASLKQGVFSAGQGDMQGAIQIQMHNVIQQGDSLTLWIDKTAMLFRRISIATTYEGNPVTSTPNYSMLPTGQVYMAQTIVNYPAKQVLTQIDNLNYQRSHL